MMLSEAIRLGAAKRPQCTGYFFALRFGGALTSCALGAALETLQGRQAAVPGNEDYDALREAFPIYEHPAECPAASPCLDFSAHEDRTVGHMIPHLNDDHRWTREAIADWVQGVEEGSL